MARPTNPAIAFPCLEIGASDVLEQLDCKEALTGVWIRGPRRHTPGDDVRGTVRRA